MVDEPENLTHRLLREIRGKQEDHSRVLDEHSGKLKQLQDEMAELHREMTYALGLGTRSIVKHKEQDARLNESFDKVDQLLSKP